MSIDSTLTIDILPSDSDNLAVDITDTPLALRINKTELVSMNDSDYIISYRNEMLSNRKWAPMEDWERSWKFNKGSIWTPDAVTNIESWIQPEYFHPELVSTTAVVWANNRIGFDPDATTVGDGGFIQDTSTKMPTLLRNADHRNFNGLKFDGINDDMRGKDASMWNVGTSDFMCYVAFKQTDSGESQPVTSKNNGDTFVLECDWTGAGNAKYTMDGDELTVRLNPDQSGFQIIGFGRSDVAVDPNLFLDRQWLRSFSYNYEYYGSAANTTNLNTTRQPWLGDAAGYTDEFDGVIYEIIFVNESIGSGVTGVTKDNKEKIEGYLAWKYNVQGVLYSGHTYENEPPTKATRVS
jgi:hypothetical protein